MILQCLPQELEALLSQYLSRNWHKMDVVSEANAFDLRPDGLACSHPSVARSSSFVQSSSPDDESSHQLPRATDASSQASASASPHQLSTMAPDSQRQLTHDGSGASLASHRSTLHADSESVANGGAEGRRSLTHVPSTASAGLTSWDSSSSLSGSTASGLDSLGHGKAWRRARRNWQRAFQVRLRCHCVCVRRWTTAA